MNIDTLPEMMCVSDPTGLGFMATHVEGNKFMIIYGYKGIIPRPCVAFKRKEVEQLPEYYYTYRNWVLLPA